jgi:ribonuclease P protein component
VSGDCSFPRASRLTAKRAFDRVFRHGRRSADPAFTVLATNNDGDAARLGLAVSKRTARHATRRNRLKRIIRESFRQADPALPAIDIVVISKASADATPADALRASLDRHWRRIARRCAD